MSDEARNEFFQAVRQQALDRSDLNSQSVLQTLENTIVRKALVAHGLGHRLAALAKDCQEELQLDSPQFTLNWFESHYRFPLRLLPSLAPWSAEFRLMEFFERPKSCPQFKSYAKALAEYGIDDEKEGVCCVFRAGRPLFCMHNATNELFRNVTAGKNTAAVVIHTSVGQISMQPFDHFLQSISHAWRLPADHG